MAWTNTGGGDHDGDNWTPADALIIAGVHYNIGTFLVTSGYTINITTGTELEVHADTITVTGTIDGNGDGSAGGICCAGDTGRNGLGSGGGGGGLWGTTNGGGGGGGGYGGAGGVGGTGTTGGANPGSAGSSYGSTDTAIISMGSGGGSGAGSGTNTHGGAGGGSVLLFAEDITISGTVNCNGTNGVGYTNKSGGGGGSGGGICLFGDVIDVSNGTFTVIGGNGGNGSIGGGGGGGGGGRVKIFYRTLTNTSVTYTLTAGTKGTSGSTAAGDGTIGNHTDTKTNTTSAKEFGQTFTPGITGKVIITQIDLWTQVVNTSGDFTLTIYDDQSKGTNYGSKSITVSATGLTSWVFGDAVELPDGTSQYYFEVVADAGGDIQLSREGNDVISSESHYFNSAAVPKIDAYEIIKGIGHVKDPEIYNTADTTTKCAIANSMLIGAVHRINTDGTGTVEYDDDFTTEKWMADSTYLNITHDETDDELDIADDGYIYWKCDAKYPVTGIPTLTSQINITTGTPTIQISTDAATWYDIDTAIVDDVDTVYELDDSTNLSLKGQTSFYFRIDCVKAGAATCSVKSFELDVDIVTIDAENPVITEGGSASTFRCDQDAASGMSATVALIYPDRRWPG